MTENRKVLHNAKLAKDDEFYTQMIDIENCIENFDLNNKVIYCNCDDPSFSNFYKFFKINFTKLGLKRLISTYKSDEPYRYDYDGINEIKTPIESGLFEYNSNIITDNIDDIIVVTNPPFSLYKEFFNFLMDLKVKFIIIANLNVLGYRDTFSKLREREIMVAYSGKQTYEFIRPDGVLQRVSSIWLTNINQTKELPIREFKTKYNPELHQKYDNYNAINCDKTADIPYDYNGVIGVPISALTILNYRQYNIVNLGAVKNGCVFDKQYHNTIFHSSSGKSSETTVLNRYLNLEIPNRLENKSYYEDNGKFYIQPYTRVLITLNKDLNNIKE